MKKVWIAVVMTVLLSGCAVEETFETVADDLIQPVAAQPRQIAVELPDEAVAPVLEGEGEQIYLCRDYEIIIETVAAGSLEDTIRKLSGYDPEELTVVKTQWEDYDRFDFVWASAGEEGERLGRGVILDDGSYHYCMSVLRDTTGKENSQVVWSAVFDSFTLLRTA